MIIFIDESGIHKQTDHSSFALVYVAVENVDEINAAIKNIERELNISHFHWADFGSKSGWGVRRKFIEAAARLPFRFKYSIVRNPVVPRESLFQSMLYLLTEQDIKRVVIDGTQPKWVERQIKRSLRSKRFSVKKLRVIRDSAEPCLCLADALAGLVRVYSDGRSGTAIELYRLLERGNKITAQLVVGGQEIPRA